MINLIARVGTSRPTGSTYPEGHIGRFTTDKPEWAQKPDATWAQDIWEFYFLGWGCRGGKLLTYAAYATKQDHEDLHLGGYRCQQGANGDGDGRTTTARFGQFSDKTYYLYLLETLDYTLLWGNYSSEIRPATQHQRVAGLGLNKGDE